MQKRPSPEKELSSALQSLQQLILENSIANDELQASNQELGAFLDGLLNVRADLRAIIAEDGFHGIPKSNSKPSDSFEEKDSKPAELAQLRRHAEEISTKGQALVEQSTMLRMKLQKVKGALLSSLDGHPKSSIDGQDGKHPGYDRLSKRERQVLSLIVAGKSSKQIAVDLGISFKTAVTHRASIMSKMEVHEIASVVREAIRRGLA